MPDMMDCIGLSATGGDASRPLEEVLQSYSSMGYRYFEAWLQGRGSAMDMSLGAEHYLQIAHRCGMGYCSLHMRTVDSAGKQSVGRAVEEALFAEKLGARVLTFTCGTKEVYIDAARKVLDAIEGRDLALVIQIHEGRALETMDDLTEVLDAVGDDRLKVQHEVGSFHPLGVGAVEVVERFGTRIGLVHIKDMVGHQSVPLGTGEVDIPGLFAALRRVGYQGFHVIEIQNEDTENTNRYFREAVDYLKKNCA
jgi:sugar phosphate isomerase/epimerase